MGDLGEGQARAFLGHESVGGRADELVVQCPQEAFVVHGAGGEGDRLLACLLRDYHYRRQACPQRLDSLPMGRPTLPPTVAYWRSLLVNEPSLRTRPLCGSRLAPTLAQPTRAPPFQERTRPTPQMSLNPAQGPCAGVGRSGQRCRRR